MSNTSTFVCPASTCVWGAGCVSVCVGGEVGVSVCGGVGCVLGGGGGGG